jgi:hypothetical protein
MPAWTTFRDAAQFERQRAEQASRRATAAARNAVPPLEVFGMHDEATIDWPRTDTLDMPIG